MLLFCKVSFGFFKVKVHLNSDEDDTSELLSV